MKETMLQYFQWYSRNDGFLYSKLKKAASSLARTGYSMIWMPPAFKGSMGSKDVGYGVYDLYDLGEFDQKGSIRTKYGTVLQYLDAIHALHRKKIRVIADIVLDHRMGGDSQERVKVQEMDWCDRTKAIGKPFETDLYTRFDFPGRQGFYSQFVWNSSCFKASDKTLDGSLKLLKFEGHEWSDKVSKENGNFDYIMGMDVDPSVEWVRNELFDWGRWYVSRTGIDGFRMDAVKSIDAGFVKDWLTSMRQTTSVSDFAVSEYWSGSLDELKSYLDASDHAAKLFDVPLHYNLHHASISSGNYDVRTLFNGTLSQERPDEAVAFVDNHDTQPFQALESWVMDWFKTSAYACILLNRCKFPCVFLGDREGIRKSKNQPVALLDEMVWIRAHLLSDDIVDLYDDDPQKACWIARGDHPVIVLFTVGDAKSRSFCFPELANRTFADISRPGRTVQADGNGTLGVDCAPGCCSVYILEEDAKLMERKLHPGLRSALSRLKKRHRKL